MSNFFISCKESRLESPRNFYGCFYLGPFDASQNLTIANALRRTLLSELTGVAITSVEIEGAIHEYSTLPGVRDSVLDILLNLKQIVFKTNFNFTSENIKILYPQIGYLKVRGPGVVRAVDLKLPPFIQCVDPEQYITTLSEDGILNMKFKIHEGKNQISNAIAPMNSKNQTNITPLDINLKRLNNNLENTSLSKQQNWKNNLVNFQNVSIDPIKAKNYTLTVDAVFMPVQKVNYIVEQDILSNSNFKNHFLILEIWTNGSIHPREALYSGLNKLYTLFSQLEQIKIINDFKKSQLLLNSDKLYNQILEKIELNKNKQINPTFSESDNFYNKNYKIKSKTSDNSNTALLPLNNKNYQKKILIKSKQSQINPLITQKNRTDIGTLNVSLRPYTCLKKANIDTVEDLIQYSREELLTIKNFGKRSLQEVENSLKNRGLHLK